MNFNLKKIVYLLLFVGIAFSCSKNEENAELVTETTSKIEIINKCIDCGTDDSLFYFYVGKNASFSSLKKSAIEYTKVEEELGKNNPLKVFYNDEMAIVKIAPLNKEEVGRFKEKRRGVKAPKELSLSDLKQTTAARGANGGFTKIALDRIVRGLKYNRTFDYINCNYAKDGCYARAHEMYRLFKGAYPNNKIYKIWGYSNQSSLTAKSSNGCCISWNYHVAPVVYCTTDSKWYVIDPSLSSKPLLISEWSNKISSCGYGQGSKPSLRFSSPDVYYRNKNNSYSEYDYSYSKTSCVLKHYSWLKKIYNDCQQTIAPSCN